MPRFLRVWLETSDPHLESAHLNIIHVHSKLVWPHVQQSHLTCPKVGSMCSGWGVLEMVLDQLKASWNMKAQLSRAKGEETNQNKNMSKFLVGDSIGIAAAVELYDD